MADFMKDFIKEEVSYGGIGIIIMGIFLVLLVILEVVMTAVYATKRGRGKNIDEEKVFLTASIAKPCVCAPV